MLHWMAIRGRGTMRPRGRQWGGGAMLHGMAIRGSGTMRSRGRQWGGAMIPQSVFVLLQIYFVSDFILPSQ